MRSLAMPLLLVALLVAPALPTTAARASASDDVPMQTIEVRVRRGDTLSHIAVRHGVSLADLRRWNPKRVGPDDMIQLGAVLTVKVAAGSDGASSGPVWEGWYAIEAGDTLGKAAQKIGVSVQDLERFNKLRPGARIRAGDLLRFEKTGPRPKASSPGRPTDGTVVGGVHLGTGRGYRLRFPKGAFGLPTVAHTLRRCAADVAKQFRGSADILIGDISKPMGGRFPPHQSHQSGRDADVGYYLAGNKQNATMFPVGARDIDPKKNWALIRCMLTSDRVVRIYMDRGLQRAMVKYLSRKGGLSAATLARLFEVKADVPESALILHSAGHDTHFHVRFACENGDGRCLEEEDDRVFKLE
jgi:LysM repeat protein